MEAGRPGPTGATWYGALGGRGGMPERVGSSEGLATSCVDVALSEAVMAMFRADV